MWEPTLGPDHPMRKPNQSGGILRSQYTNVEDSSFNDQFNAYQFGNAVDMSSNERITNAHQETRRAKTAGE